MNQTWPMQMDVPLANAGVDGQGQQQQNPFGGPGGVFMGSDAPGGPM